MPAAERDAALAEARRVPYATGNHWIATRGDQVVHVVGTFHLSDPQMDGIAARLAEEIDVRLFLGKCDKWQ